MDFSKEPKTGHSKLQVICFISLVQQPVIYIIYSIYFVQDIQKDHYAAFKMLQIQAMQIFARKKCIIKREEETLCTMQVFP